MIHAHDIRVRVTEIEEVAPATKRLRLQPADGGCLPQFSAGAHITVALGDNDAALRNPYTLSGSSQDRAAYDITVLRAENSRGGSAFLHERVALGHELSISAPINLFPINALARRHVMIAGGIGITPFLPMTEHLIDLSQKFELHYAMRRDGAAPYEKLLRSRLGQRLHVYRSDMGERIDLEPISMSAAPSALSMRRSISVERWVGPEKTSISSALPARRRAILSLSALPNRTERSLSARIKPCLKRLSAQASSRRPSAAAVLADNAKSR